MEPAPLLLLLFLLLLGLLWGCSGRPAGVLSVMPYEPVVQYGGSVELNCSLACAEGTVQWKGLDTNLGSVTFFPTHSILHISRAVVAMEGTKICQGTCHRQHYQHVVQLKVFAIPDTLQLEAVPRALEQGQPTSLLCSARGVYPISGLDLTWYRGGRALKADWDVTETEEELFDVVSTLPVAGEEVVKGEEFRCEVTLSVGHKTFTRAASVVASAGATTEQPVATSASPGSPRGTATAAAGTPSTAGPATTTALPPEPSVPTRGPTTALTTRLPEPNAETVQELSAASDPPSTAHPTSQDLITASLTAWPATTGSSTVTAPAVAPGTAADSIPSGTSPAKNGTGPSMEPVSDCSLQIQSLPPNGTRGRALRIECHARCTGNTSIRWLRTPVALSQYREEAAGSSSVLQLDHAEPRHQGHYQCVLLGRRSQVVSLQLAVLDDPLSAGPAIAGGTMVSLLGLVVAAVTSHRLWKRFRSQYELP